MNESNENFSDPKPAYIGGDSVGGDKVMGNQNKTITTVTGNENIVGNQDVTISTQDIEDMKKSIEEFQTAINDQLKAVPSLTNQQQKLQETIDKLSKEVSDIQSNEPISENKKKNIMGIMKEMAYKLVDISPEIAETITSMTPLAPFSKSIGKGISYFKDLVNHKKNEH